MPTKNEAIGQLTRRRGRYIFNAAKIATMDRIEALALAAKIPVFESAHVRFEWVEQNMKRDPDGVTFGASYVLDALQECGVLGNDGWRQILGISHKWRLDRKLPGVLVTLIQPG